MNESWAVRLAPEPFRDFLPYTSPAALKVIHAKQVLSRALGVAQRVSDQSARAREATHLQESLVAAGLGSGLRVSFEPAPSLMTSELSEADRLVIGGRVLDLYFHLLHWEGPLFLDLRPRHFSWSAERQQLSYFPSTLWCRPEPEFMQRLRALYTGFYQRDSVELARGIDLYRWDCSESAGFAERIEVLLRSHFGSAESTPTRFAIAHFRTTFDAIFAEVAASRAKLHPDLTFLGVELVGLYLTLEALNVPLDARSAFDRARR